MYRVVGDELSVPDGVVVVDCVGEALAEVDMEGVVVGVAVGADVNHVNVDTICPKTAVSAA